MNKLVHHGCYELCDIIINCWSINDFFVGKYYGFANHTKMFGTENNKYPTNLKSDFTLLEVSFIDYHSTYFIEFRPPMHFRY